MVAAQKVRLEVTLLMAAPLSSEVAAVAAVVTEETMLDMVGVLSLPLAQGEAEQEIAQVPLVGGLVALEVRGGFTAVMEA